MVFDYRTSVQSAACVLALRVAARSRVRPLAPPIHHCRSLKHRCRFNLDQERGISKRDDANPRRRGLSGATERLSKGVTHGCRVFRAVVHDVDSQTDHVTHTAPACFDNRLNVPKRLSRLIRQVGAADELPVRIPCRLARHIQSSGPARRDCLRKPIVLASEQRWWIDVLLRHPPASHAQTGPSNTNGCVFRQAPDVCSV
jgi:hypothetical protein